MADALIDSMMRICIGGGGGEFNDKRQETVRSCRASHGFRKNESSVFRPEKCSSGFRLSFLSLLSFAGQVSTSSSYERNTQEKYKNT